MGLAFFGGLVCWCGVCCLRTQQCVCECDAIAADRAFVWLVVFDCFASRHSVSGWCGVFVGVIPVVWIPAFGLGFVFDGEFDPGSGRTLAACFTHASRTMMPSLLG